jgi:serine/threonine protein kinase
MDELGRGATGVVFRAQDPAIGRIIAIKTIQLSGFTDEAERERLRERLFREAQSAGILSHPNIVTIYDIAEENGLAYIFMEYVDGAPLEKLLSADQPLTREAVISIFRQTAIALDYAHRKGIVHRDIKPANILIHDGNVAKITDFGVAKILSQQMTQSGVMMGTPNYMSPEQVQGHAVDGRADEFGLAVICYEVLTGEKPFVADQLPSLLYRIVREDPVAPQRLNPSLPAQVEVVFRKALAKNAQERYPTCSEFVEALVHACFLNPNWHALPRAAAHAMPTIGAGAAIDHTSVHRDPEPAVVVADIPRTRRREREDAEGSNPLLKSLAWLLAGLGLLGLVLFGAQKFLLHRGEDTAQTQSLPADNSSAKPSPVGDSPRPDERAKAEPKTDAPTSTTPESTSAEPRTKPEKPRETEPRVRPAIPAPDAAPKSSERTVQVLTDPPGAQIVVDSDSARTCKTPCMLSVATGRHVLNANLPGYRSYPRVFSVPQESDIFLQLSKTTGTLSVSSSPPGATIEINNEAQSKNTPAVFNLTPGTYRVRVARNGTFLDFEVDLKDGQFVSKNVSF